MSTEWVSLEKRTLRHLWLAGAPDEAILAALPGRAWSGIRKMRAQMGLPPRPRRVAAFRRPHPHDWPQQDEATFEGLWLAGAPISAIRAAMPRYSVKALKCKRVRMGLPARGGPRLNIAAAPEALAA
jgi:hypothetical protein